MDRPRSGHERGGVAKGTAPVAARRAAVPRGHAATQELHGTAGYAGLEVWRE